MSTPRVPPAGFVALLRQFPDFVDCRFNDALARWEFIFKSAAGLEVSQFFGWAHNPLTGTPIAADPATGLLPFRDLDEAAQAEILESCQRTFLGNREDGPGTWAENALRVREHNRAISRKSARQRAEDYAYALQQVDLRRRWYKDHQPSGQKIIVS